MEGILIFREKIIETRRAKLVLFTETTLVFYFNTIHATLPREKTFALVVWAIYTGD